MLESTQKKLQKKFWGNVWAIFFFFFSKILHQRKQFSETNTIFKKTIQPLWYKQKENAYFMGLLMEKE